MEFEPVGVNSVWHPWACARCVLHKFVLQAVTQFPLPQLTNFSLAFLTLQVL
jgi:hypothetical protein